MRIFVTEFAFPGKSVALLPGLLRSFFTRFRASKKSKKDVGNDDMDISGSEEEEAEPKLSTPTKAQPSRKAKSPAATPKQPSPKLPKKSVAENEIDADGFAKPRSKKRERKSAPADDVEALPAPKRNKTVSKATPKDSSVDEDTLFGTFLVYGPLWLFEVNLLHLRCCKVKNWNCYSGYRPSENLQDLTYGRSVGAR